MSKVVSRKEDQPIQALALIASYQLQVPRAGKSKRRHLGRPILDKGGTKCLLIHVGTNILAPSRSKLVELVMRLGCIATCVALKVVQANVSDDVDMLQRG
jgi:hypothetical protein